MNASLAVKICWNVRSAAGCACSWDLAAWKADHSTAQMCNDNKYCHDHDYIKIGFAAAVRHICSIFHISIVVHAFQTPGTPWYLLGTNTASNMLTAPACCTPERVRCDVPVHRANLRYLRQCQHLLSLKPAFPRDSHRNLIIWYSFYPSTLW